MIRIEYKHFLEDIGAWHVLAYLSLNTGSRRCTHVIELPEDATDEQLEAAILKMYKA